MLLLIFVVTVLSVVILFAKFLFGKRNFKIEIIAVLLYAVITIGILFLNDFFDVFEDDEVKNGFDVLKEPFIEYTKWQMAGQYSILLLSLALLILLLARKSNP